MANIFEGVLGETKPKDPTNTKNIFEGVVKPEENIDSSSTIDFSRISAPGPLDTRKPTSFKDMVKNVFNTIFNPVTSPFSIINSQKSLEKGFKPILEKVSTIPVVKKGIEKTSEVTENVPLKLFSSIEALSPEKTYKEAYDIWSKKSKDPSNPVWQKFLFELQSSVPQVGFGVAMSFIPVAGRPLASTYWATLSANEQLQERGKVTSISEIGIDVIGDRILGNSIESLLKAPKKSLEKSIVDGFLKTFGKGFTRGFLVESGTEVAQDLGKFAIQYNNATTQQQKSDALAKAKHYFTSGQVLMTIGVAGTTGGIISGGASSISNFIPSKEKELSFPIEEAPQETIPFPGANIIEPAPVEIKLTKEEAFAQKIEKRQSGQEALRKSPKGRELLAEQLAREEEESQKQAKRVELRKQVDELYNSLFRKPEIDKQTDEIVNFLTGNKEGFKLESQKQPGIEELTKDIDKHIEGTRKKYDLMADRAGARVRQFTSDQSQGEEKIYNYFKKSRAGADMAQRSKDLKNLAFEAEYAENPEFRDLVDRRDKLLENSLNVPIDEISPEYLNAVLGEVTSEESQTNDAVSKFETVEKESGEVEEVEREVEESITEEKESKLKLVPDFIEETKKLKKEVDEKKRKVSKSEASRFDNAIKGIKEDIKEDPERDVSAIIFGRGFTFEEDLQDLYNYAKDKGDTEFTKVYEDAFGKSQTTIESITETQSDESLLEVKAELVEKLDNITDSTPEALIENWENRIDAINVELEKRGLIEVPEDYQVELTEKGKAVLAEKVENDKAEVFTNGEAVEKNKVYKSEEEAKKDMTSEGQKSIFDQPLTQMDYVLSKFLKNEQIPKELNYLATELERQGMLEQVPEGEGVKVDMTGMFLETEDTIKENHIIDYKLSTEDGVDPEGLKEFYNIDAVEGKNWEDLQVGWGIVDSIAGKGDKIKTSELEKEVAGKKGATKTVKGEGTIVDIFDDGRALVQTEKGLMNLDYYKMDRVVKDERVDGEESPLTPKAQTLFSSENLGKALPKEKVIAELRELLPEKDIKILTQKDLIISSNGRIAFGSSMENLIKLIEQDGKIFNKVAYHEAFHQYEQKFLTEEETFETSKLVVGYAKEFMGKDITLRQASEFKADLFADWYAKRKTFTGRLLQFFEKILLHIKKWIDGKKRLTEVFHNIVNKKRPSITSDKQHDTVQFKEGDSFPVFKGFKDITTKVLNRLKGRSVVSAQFITDLSRMADVKQAERQVVSDALVNVISRFTNSKEIGSLSGQLVALTDDLANKRITQEAFDNDSLVIWEKIKEISVNEKIPVKAFADAVKTELLPLVLENTKLNSNGSRTPLELHQNVVLPNNLRGPVADYNENVYTSPIKNSAGEIHFPGVTGNYFAHTRIENLPNSAVIKSIRLNQPFNTEDLSESGGTTRRVIEIQSDLFQKGRLDGEAPRVSQQGNGKWGMFTRNSNDPVGPQFATEAEAKAFANKEIAKLEPYRNTWHERIIREKVKQAAIDGKTKLQFPTGETIASIEGWGNAQKYFRFTDGRQMNQVRPKVGELITEDPDRGLENDNLLGIITRVTGESSVRVANVLTAENTEDVVLNIINKRLDRDGLDELRLTDIKDFTEPEIKILDKVAEGVSFSGRTDFKSLAPEHQTVYKFYEKDISKYLSNRYGAKKITDAQGVEWIEVKLDKSMGKEPIEAFKEVEPSEPLSDDEVAVFNLIQNGEAIPDSLKPAIDSLKAKGLLRQDYFPSAEAKPTKTRKTVGSRPSVRPFQPGERISQRGVTLSRSRQDITQPYMLSYKVGQKRVVKSFSRIEDAKWIYDAMVRLRSKNAMRRGELPKELQPTDQQKARIHIMLDSKKITPIQAKRLYLAYTGVDSTLKMTPEQANHLIEMIKNLKPKFGGKVTIPNTTDLVLKETAENIFKNKTFSWLIDIFRSPAGVFKSIGIGGETAPIFEGMKLRRDFINHTFGRITEWQKEMGITAITHLTKKKTIKLQSARMFNAMNTGDLSKLSEQEALVVSRAIDLAKNIADNVDDTRKSIGLEPMNRRQNYITNLLTDEGHFLIQTTKMAPNELYAMLDMRLPQSVFNRLLLERKGGLPIKHDFWLALKAMTQMHARYIYLNPPVHRLARFMKFYGDKVPLLSRKYIQSRIARFLNRPTLIESFLRGLDESMTKFVGKIPFLSKKYEVELQSGMKEILDVPRINVKVAQRAVPVLKSIRYTYDLAWSVSFYTLNLTQFWVNTVPKLRGTPLDVYRSATTGYAQMILDFFRPSKWEYWRQRGVLTEMDNVIDNEYKAQFGGNVLNIFAKLSEFNNRVATTLAAEHNIKLLVKKGKADLLYKELNKRYGEDAKEYARSLSDVTQFKYGIEEKPIFFDNPIADLYYQYNTFAIKQAELVGGMMKNTRLLSTLKDFRKAHEEGTTKEFLTDLTQGERGEFIRFSMNAFILSVILGSGYVFDSIFKGMIPNQVQGFKDVILGLWDGDEDKLRSGYKKMLKPPGYQLIEDLAVYGVKPVVTNAKAIKQMNLIYSVVTGEPVEIKSKKGEVIEKIKPKTALGRLFASTKEKTAQTNSKGWDSYNAINGRYNSMRKEAIELIRDGKKSEAKQLAKDYNREAKKQIKDFKQLGVTDLRLKDIIKKVDKSHIVSTEDFNRWLKEN